MIPGSSCFDSVSNEMAFPFYVRMILLFFNNPVPLCYYIKSGYFNRGGKNDATN